MTLDVLLIDPAYVPYNEGTRLAGPLIVGGIEQAGHNLHLSAFIDTEQRKMPITQDEFGDLERKFISDSVEAANNVDVVMATTWTDSAGRVSKILRQIREEHHDIPVIMGGYHIRTLAEQGRPSLPLEAYDFVDIASISQQGIFHIKQILEAVEGKRKLASIPGIAYRHGSEIKANMIKGMTPESREMVSAFGTIKGYKAYADQGLEPEWLMIAASQGCPWTCYFCVDAASRFARKDTTTFVKELEELKKIFSGLRQVRLSDPDATALAMKPDEKEKMYGIFEALGNAELYWSSFARSDEVDAKMLKFMYDHYCRSLLAGIEVADYEMLRNIRKGGNVSVGSSRDFVLRSLEQGIIPRISLLLGARGETHDSIQRTIQYASEATRAGAYVAIHILEPRIGEKVAILNLAKELGYHWSPDHFDVDKPDHLYPEWAMQNSETIFPALEMHATEQIVRDRYSLFPNLVRQIRPDWTTFIQRVEVARFADEARREISRLGHSDPGRASKDDIYLTQKEKNKE